MHGATRRASPLLPRAAMAAVLLVVVAACGNTMDHGSMDGMDHGGGASISQTEGKKS